MAKGHKHRPGTATGHAGATAGALDEAIWPTRTALRPEALDAASRQALEQAMAQQRAGQLPQAAEAYQALLARSPQLADAWHLLGVVRKQQGQADEAVRLISRAIALDPRQATFFSNLGSAWMAAGQTCAAQLSLQQALQLNGKLASAWLNLVQLHLQADDAEAAELAGQMALAALPDNAELTCARAKALLALGKPAEALRGFEQALRWAPALGAARVGKADALMQMGQYDAALACLDRGQGLQGGDFVSAMRLQGAMLEALGDKDAAAAAYEAGLRVWPGNVALVYARAQVQRVRLGEPFHDLLQQLRPNAASVSGCRPRAELNYALGKAAVDVGEMAEAARLYAEGARAMVELLGDREEKIQRQHAEAIRQQVDADWLRSVAGQGHDSEQPIFILGMPRSGTTLLEQILASHPQVYAAGELGFLNEALHGLALPDGRVLRTAAPGLDAAAQQRTLRARGEAYLARVAALHGYEPKARFTDKMPENYLNAGLIRALFPKATIIHARRDPLDTCISCYTTLFTHGKGWSFDLVALGRTYRRYDALMAHWRQTLGEHYLEVRYEALVEDTEAVVRQVLEACRLPWDPACLRFHEADRAVRTASVNQVRQPIYRSSMARWRPWLPYIGPLLAEVAEVERAYWQEVGKTVVLEAPTEPAPASPAPMPAQVAPLAAPPAAVPSAAEERALVTLFEKGALPEAERMARELLERYPQSAFAWKSLGAILQGQRRAAEALPAMQRAAELLPNDPQAHSNLGNGYKDLGDVSKAEACYRRALSLKPDYAEAYGNLGVTLQAQGRLDEAMACMHKALELKPDFNQAVVSIGGLLRDKGAFDEAETWFRRALKAEPERPDAWAALPTLRKMTAADKPWLEAAERIVSRALLPFQEVPLRHSMGKFCDDTGDYDQAFGHYRRANELKRHFRGAYDRHNREAVITQLMSAWSADAVRQNCPGANASEVPVFIVGMPRSGTSLTEQIIASHPSTFGAGELNFWYEQAQRYKDPCLSATLDAGTLAQIAEDCLANLGKLAPGATRVVDKMPSNFMWLGLIHAVFPKARILHTMRNPIDTCLSIYFQNFNSGHNYSSSLDDMSHYYREYHRLMAHWRKVMPAEVLLEVPYEALVEDQEAWSKRIIEFLGLPWDESCLAFHKTDRRVGTASNWQVRQPIYKSSKERWRNYEQHVGPLLPLLELYDPARGQI